MTLRSLALGFMLLGPAVAADAATIVILTDPVSLERRTLVYDTPGPDRVLLCMAPPGEAGCTVLPVRRNR